ncbi:MAG: inositol monophosphatase family protein [Thermohalobaculum sp.]
MLHDAAIEHRRIGSAAIGLARVADGVADFYYEAHLNCWDALAGMLIAQEAGARVIAPPLERFIACGGAVLCGVPAMVELIDALASDLHGNAPDGEVAVSEAAPWAE